jgi:hypothetical protein
MRIDFSALFKPWCLGALAFVNTINVQGLWNYRRLSKTEGEDMHRAIDYKLLLNTRRPVFIRSLKSVVERSH